MNRGSYLYYVMTTTRPANPEQPAKTDAEPVLEEQPSPSQGLLRRGLELLSTTFTRLRAAPQPAPEPEATLSSVL